MLYCFCQFGSYSLYNADLAHLVERHLAKVEVASSSLVIRSMFVGEISLAREKSREKFSGFLFLLLTKAQVYYILLPCADCRLPDCVEM